jgi:hypothetical protein
MEALKINPPVAATVIGAEQATEEMLHGQGDRH